MGYKLRILNLTLFYQVIATKRTKIRTKHLIIVKKTRCKSYHMLSVDGWRGGVTLKQVRKLN